MRFADFPMMPREDEISVAPVLRPEPKDLSGSVVSLGHMRIDRVTVKLSRSPDWHGIDIQVRLDVIDVRNGEQAPVMLLDRFPADIPIRDQREFVRHMVSRALTHEMDEWLRIDGVQLVDPHAGERASMYAAAVEDVAAARQMTAGGFPVGFLKLPTP